MSLGIKPIMSAFFQLMLINKWRLKTESIKRISVKLWRTVVFSCKAFRFVVIINKIVTLFDLLNSTEHRGACYPPANSWAEGEQADIRWGEDTEPGGVVDPWRQAYIIDCSLSAPHRHLPGRASRIAAAAATVRRHHQATSNTLDPRAGGNLAQIPPHSSSTRHQIPNHFHCKSNET